MVCYNYGMKRSVFLFLFVIAPIQVLAQTQGVPKQVGNFMERVYTVILNPVITIMFAVAILYLSYSVFNYTLNKDKLDKEKLKASLIYGVVGVAVMSLVFGIMKFVARTITGDETIIEQNV